MDVLDGFAGSLPDDERAVLRHQKVDVPLFCPAELLAAEDKAVIVRVTAGLHEREGSPAREIPLAAICRVPERARRPSGDPEALCNRGDLDFRHVIGVARARTPVDTNLPT